MSISFSKKLLYFNIIFLGLLLSTLSLEAQKKSKKKKSKQENLTLDDNSLKTDSVPSLELMLSEEELGVEEEEKKRKKKKKKKKVYFGLKTKKGFAKKGTSTVTTELFRYVSMEHLMENPYQQAIHYYDAKKKRLREDDYNTVRKKLKKGEKIVLLHGEYRQIKEGIIREEGFFYKGLKHGEWSEYDRKDILIERVKYDLGWLEASKITYYDAAETKLKEVIPILHDRIEGTYYRFYENGYIAEKGEYANNVRIGLWREYYPNLQRKKDTQHPYRWWVEEKPYLLREWNERGEMVYDHDRGGKLGR